jgi:hypothetical protein
MTTVANKSVILTYNYAISGSTVDKSVVDMHTSSLVEQVQTFTTWTKSATRAWTGSNAIFSFWVCLLSTYLRV